MVQLHAGGIVDSGYVPDPARQLVASRTRSQLARLAPDQAQLDLAALTKRFQQLWQAESATSSGRRQARDWLANKVCEEYTLSPDHDDNWRTGDSLDEIIAESKLDTDSLRAGIQRFVTDRQRRLERIRTV